MARLKLEIENFDLILKRLNQLNGDAKPLAEKALIETFNIVQPKAKEAMENANLPAKGKYSKSETIKALKQAPKIYWNGDVAEVSVGFDLNDYKNAGFVSIFLMYGTPKMKPDKKLYEAFYSGKTQKEIAEAQKKVFIDEIGRLSTQ